MSDQNPLNQRDSFDATPEDSLPNTPGKSPGLNGSTSNAGASDGADKQQKKRMRVPTSCSVCRKRKIRCDKQKPVCGACVKSNVKHLCHFEEPSWLNSEDLLKYAKPVQSQPINSNSRASSNSSGPTTLRTDIASGSNLPYIGVDQVNNIPTPSHAPPNIINGVNINNLPPEAKKLFEELSFRVKHLEASIAVHDLSHSHQDSSSKSEANTPQQISALGSSFNELTQRSDYRSTNAINSSLNRDFAKDVANAGPFYDFNPNARIEFFNYLPFMIKKTRLESHAPFSLISNLRKDVYLKVLWMHIWKSVEPAGNLPCKQGNNDKVGSCVAFLLSKAGKSLSGFFELRKQKKELKETQALLDKQNLDLNELILQALPIKKTIMALCFRFFKNVYPFLPFVNENSFFTEIDAIIGPLGFNNERVKTLQITSRYDYATLGLLLLIIRFAYFSITDEEFEENVDFKALKDDKSAYKSLYAIDKCLFHYKFLRKSYSLKLIQFALYYKLYSRCNPLDDDVSDGSEGQIMLGTLFSMAYSIGFNRDPEQLIKLTGSAKKKPQAQLWRRIWYKLLELDCMESITLGTPLHCNDDSTYDTTLPQEDPDDDDVDAFITQDFKYVAKRIELYRDVCNTCLNINIPPTVLQVIHLIKRIETFIQVNLGSMKDIVNNSALKSYVKVKKIAYLIEAHSLLLSLNLRVFRHFLETNNQHKTLFYLEECLVLSLKISNSTMNMIYNEKYYFGKGFSFHLVPSANNAITKSAMFLCSIVLNALHAKHLTPDSNVVRQKFLADLIQEVLTNLDNTIQLLDRLSIRQYNFSRVVMAFKLFYHQLKDPAFDFVKAADYITSQLEERSHEKLIHEQLHDLTSDDIPKTNYLMDFLDSEITHLTSKCQTDLLTILQPAISKSKYSDHQKEKNGSESSDVSRKSPAQTTTESTPSYVGSGTYYNPISGTYHKKNSVSGPPVNGSDASGVEDPSPLTSASINFDNIFEDASGTRLNKMLNPEYNLNGSYDPNLLTSEDYYSLFGVFEDYNAQLGPSYEEL